MAPSTIVEDALDLAAEIGVAGRVDDVDARVLPVDRGRLGEDGDAALLLEIVGIHRAFGHALVLAERAGLLEQFVDQRGLAMVDVRDDRDVAEFHGRRRRDMDRLQPRGGAGRDLDRGGGNVQRLRQQFHERGIGLPLFGHGAHPRLEEGPTVGQLLDPFYRIARGFRRQPDEEATATCRRLDEAGTQISAGATVVHSSWRTKKMSKRSTIGEMSMPPRSGSTLRIGRSAGSVSR
jgi:hypothetical protein